MKYRLSLDLGVSSIGSAIIHLDEQNQATKIIDAGVNIFPISEGAEERRHNRQMRKTIKRRHQRLIILKKKLSKHGLWDESIADEIYRLSPYAIRKQAISGKLDSLPKLGRALLHLAKHRGAGYVDMLCETVEQEEDLSSTDNKPKEKEPTSFEKLIKYMDETGSRTVGEYFYKRIYELDKKDTRRMVRQKGKIVDYAVPRYLVKEEFNAMWDKQARYYDVLTPELKEDISDILFFERAAAPYATADCIYIEGEKRLSKAHPLVEQRRIYEAANNIRLQTDVENIPLSPEQRDKVINDILRKGKNANKTSLRKVLALDKTVNIIFSDDEKGIKAYLYARDEFQQVPFIGQLSENALGDLIEFMADPVDANDKYGRLLREEALLDALKERLGIDDEEKIAKLLALLPQGRGKLGKTATQELLSILQEEVIDHRSAADKLVSQGDERFVAEEVIAQRLQGSCNELPYYGKVLKADIQPIHEWQKMRNQSLNADEKEYGKIANPAVHMMLNQLKKVVNDIIRIYGRPYEINIELGRDVGMSTKKKNQWEAQQKKNETLNDEARKYLEENNISNLRNGIKKYKLAKQQGWKDAFNPTKNIDARFFGFEIEHLIPQQKGGTDALNNLVLVDRNENQGKGTKFPYEYFESTRTPEEISSILKNIRGNKDIPDGKKWRFEMDARDIYDAAGDGDESNRYLTDTRYMSKLAARYLRVILDYQTDGEEDDTIHTRILSIKGAHTERLRRIWNLSGLEYDLMGMCIPRNIKHYVHEETGEIFDGDREPEADGPWKFVDKGRNPEWLPKPRIDHRHHALDAIALGCINRNFIQELNWSDKRGISLSSNAYPLPFAHLDKMNRKQALQEFRETVHNVLTQIRVSHKADHNRQGQFHEETARTILLLNVKDEVVTRYNRSFSNIDIKKLEDLDKLLPSETIASAWHDDIGYDRDILQKLINAINHNYARAEQELKAEYDKLKQEGKSAKNVVSKDIITRAHKISCDDELINSSHQSNRPKAEMDRERLIFNLKRIPTYERPANPVVIKKHGVAYKSGNNHCVIFYEIKGKVHWEVVRRFDVNDKKFHPKWKREGGKVIWQVQQGDMLEIATPEEWTSYTDETRCLVRVKKFSSGKMAIDLAHDARGTSPPAGSPSYMKVASLSRGLSFYSKGHARKIELTPFGKVKRKHKALWPGEK